MVFIVGLTGGIGSGKTSVAKLFATWGATVVDADQIAHNLLAPGSKALTQVAKRFGADIIDDSGQLNRDALAKIVFTNPTARTDLENITHPLIAAQAWSQLTQAKTPIAIYDVPLLAEQALEGNLPPYDGVVVVETELNTRLQRLNKRGLNPTQAKARIATQASDTQRRPSPPPLDHHQQHHPRRATNPNQKSLASHQRPNPNHHTPNKPHSCAPRIKPPPPPKPPIK